MLFSKDLQIHNGSLEIEKIHNSWYEKYKNLNYGAFITFVGIIRDENSIDGLSFDVYEPLLEKWFKSWQERAKKQNAIVFLAHSRGDVLNHTSSYIAGVCSPQRRVALELIDSFVEDFKKNAPIWKYDMRNKQRIYAKDRSQKIDGAGILA
ncbi:molybdenum cofactor biosynthesis protein MoaE [Aliarcobacter trophiarum LMG 25534]|uniref:Molybdopterin synthase catalytic subunit n=1 Tax=Aliarcobacter trophiarum LMG 25534 TaxID=1032241 RepID=A0ABY0EWF1_9BACT|nr:molybdenum cofactor biosynthesis protein MoaE [Aliarcobacter trophiarum]RXI25364.1 molybdenum cofactor biosynthesis protein MoaE [Aliarcobacter trophiarum]RXJ91499.1 molybdenum cofactor biosynthesis protein MoaE [Aliarcobacter trophiarum LMG 25534]